ncbi:gamma-glutamyl kinase [Rhodophyticola sp. CCM32]|uniref:gamma-glutamyl kinase n=1 Tax=Rhodophyticola sp. CCM32 TaxID=2916397 RepID=UPI001EE5387F|nr:gamma-glutamyl kinase [Rhodophyticola sp. CCM32]
MFWKQKLVLFAVPKTGTTALETAARPFASTAILNPPGMKHVSVRRYHNNLSGFFEQRGSHPMESMAIMREPISWLDSWYRYRRRPQLSGRENSTEAISFEDFVTAWLEESPPAFANIGSQARFLRGEDTACGVTHLFRYDRLADAVTFLEGRIGETLTLPRSNISPKIPVHLSSKLETRLRAERSADFDLWDWLLQQKP